MSNNTALKQCGRKDETPSSGGGGGGRKTSSLRPPPPEQTLKCPRCDSNNTKFCYYNNYNLTQPRHFCKACRRYWTKGGALRNIPVGGGCRKSKKAKSCTSSSSLDHHGGQLKLLDGLPPPVMDFQLPPTNRLNHFPSSSYGVQPSSNNNNNNNNNLPFMNLLDPLGFSFPMSMITHATKQNQNQNQSGGSAGLSSFQEMGSTYTNLTSSIESLSSNLNQDLHWRLQQQRLATLVGQPKEPLLFQNLEIPKPNPSLTIGVESRKDGNVGNGGVAGGLATEWFFDNNYSHVNMQNPTSASMNREDNQNGNVNNWNGNGINQGWNQMNQYSGFP